MSGTTEPRTRKTTLLQWLVQQRHLTREQTRDLLDRRARAMGVTDYALSLRQLDRFYAGDVATMPRPSVCRVLEAEFGYPVKQLLGLAADVIAGEHYRESAGHSDRTLRTLDFVSWMADQSNLPFDGLYAAVAERADKLSAEPVAVRAARDHARGAIDRAQVADALHRYYGEPKTGFYTATVGGSPFPLTVLTDSRWLGLEVPLDADHQDFRLSRPETAPFFADVTPTAVGAAVARLATVEITDTVLVNNPLYRLIQVDITPSQISATLGLTTFATYALSADLLEGELLDMLAGLSDVRQGPRLPLRDHYLPSLASARSLDDRICAGGPACLVAIARADDFLLVIQERSRRVINVAGRLSVIPKAFHQPVGEVHETALSESIERELEEELLGRQDLEEVSAAGRRAAPRHHQTISEPMRWLLDRPEAYRLVCTGFGINMISGNYEFACAVIIGDLSWWDAYGDRVQANWEALRLRCYSSRDTEGLAKLIADGRWSNEGLFALLEGLRCLSRHDPSRVAIPPIEVSV